MTQLTQPVRWNLFAAVLEDALRVHGYRLGHLNDRAGIHPEKVRRLQRSLKLPRFYLLPPEELDAVLSAFPLSMQEKVRIRAAVLATAVEAKLMDRIAPAAALQAAWLTLPVLERALRPQLEDGGPIRFPPDRDNSPDELTPFERRFDAELEAMERAVLAMHMAETAHMHMEEGLRTQEAHEWFRAARDGFDLATPSERDESWQFWRDEAQMGMEKLRSRLDHADATG